MDFLEQNRIKDEAMIR